MKVVPLSGLMLVFGLTAVLPLVARADEAADKKAEIQRLKEEAKKRAAERKAAAEKAAQEKATTDKPVTGDKTTHDTKGTGGATGAGGASSTGGAASTSGGASTKGASGGGASGGAASKVIEKDAPLPAGDIATLRKDRPERRKASVERLHRRWGNLLADPKGAADLKQHSRRVAFLQRIRIIADAKKDTKSVEAVDELLTQEDERHSRAMNALREGALK